MNRKLSITLILLGILCLSFVGQVMAQTRVPGVKAEDTFKYSLTSTWTSTNASATVPPDILEINNTQWYSVTVSYVMDVNVTTRDFWHFANGTENPSLVIQDVESGQWYYMTGLVGIIGANISAGQLLHPTGQDGWMVNETVSREYASGKRDTNLVSFTTDLLDENNVTIGTRKEDYYFDKATGMLVERRDEVSQRGDQATIVLKLTETNVWAVSSAVSELPLPLPILAGVIAAVVAVVLVVAVLLYRGRRGRRRKSRH
ncbi:MAG: hypothetical protein ACE14S_07855 [Candidatus Bathyarchaeia archaeon]